MPVIISRRPVKPCLRLFERKNTGLTGYRKHLLKLALRRILHHVRSNRRRKQGRLVTETGVEERIANTATQNRRRKRGQLPLATPSL